MLFATLIALHTAFSLYIRIDFLTDSVIKIVATYFIGAACAYLVSAIMLLLFHRWISRLSNPLYFSLTLIGLALAVVGFTALIFALQYRIFYTQWHAPSFSKVWFFEQAFTTLGAFFQFAVIGIRYYLPAAFLILFGASAILYRRTR